MSTEKNYECLAPLTGVVAMVVFVVLLASFKTTASRSGSVSVGVRG